MDGLIEVTKLEAAHRQLETAVELRFAGKDSVSIHTLAAAAADILRDLGRAAGMKLTVKDYMLDFVKPEYAKEVRRLMSDTQNFFKHANKDPDGVHAFTAAQTDGLLLDACVAYRTISGHRPITLYAFELWSALTWARELVVAPILEVLSPESRDEWASLPPQEFLERVRTNLQSSAA